ncbi:MAG: MarR family transcriptional regulator [Gammaproteobacteria bacterium]|nr:MarR family transcriptional regulator [Gammaproteobacteria bacterium]
MSDKKKAVAAGLLLRDFVPFRLNRLATAVSEHLSQIYRDRFGLEIPEWRVLVTVGERKDCTAQRVCASTRMHKTRISRAVASLLKRGLIERQSNAGDGREFTLHLTKTGSRLYAELVPLALERERLLLSCLGESQRHGFIDGLTRLEDSLGLLGEV